MDKDATIIKILSDMGVREEPPLTPEQEELLKRALDPDCAFYDRVTDLFNPPK